jgi:hypothetical protein
VILTDRVTHSALKYLPQHVLRDAPAVDFDIGAHFQHLSCAVVAEEDRPAVAAQLGEAFAWCQRRFRLGIRAPGGRSVASITRFTVGRSLHEGETLTASSAQAPTAVLIAARWPLSSPYRLASLMAHESIHQALYVREAAASPVRAGSLGFSPWKNTLRPGRLVWHAFWTFSCQLAMLGEALRDDERLVAEDAGLIAFAADIWGRLLVCMESLRSFAIVDADEMRACEEALTMLEALWSELGQRPGYDRAQKAAESRALAEYETWALAFLQERGAGRAAGAAPSG